MVESAVLATGRTESEGTGIDDGLVAVAVWQKPGKHMILIMKKTIAVYAYDFIIAKIPDF